MLHLRRVAGQITLHQFDQDYRGLRVDQILVSPPFDTSPRDEDTEDLLDEYRRLATIDEPTEQERLKLERVAAELQVPLPSAAERAEANQARAIIEAAAAQQIKAIAPPDRERVLAELKLQIQEAMTRPRRSQ